MSLGPLSFHWLTLDHDEGRAGDQIVRLEQAIGAHCRPNIERIVRWTLRDDELDQGLRELEGGLNN